MRQKRLPTFSLSLAPTMPHLRSRTAVLQDEMATRKVTKRPEYAGIRVTFWLRASSLLIAGPPLEAIMMELAQSRFVTDDVERLAALYAALLGVPATLNEYYVEVPAGPVTVGFSRRKFTECRLDQRPCDREPARSGKNILDFVAPDVDAEHERIAAMGVTWLMPPATQPWGSRAMIFTDPDGNLINVFARR
jgi:predicted enzyme related to lactoylglutathione lyase